MTIHSVTPGDWQQRARRAGEFWADETGDRQADRPGEPAYEQRMVCDLGAAR